MKAFLLALALILFFQETSLAETDRAFLLNQTVHLSALVRTDRLPRSWKTLKLIPGKYTYYYYEWLMPDGGFAIQGVPNPIPNVMDRRPLSDSHPNLAIILWPIQFVGVGTAIELSSAKL